MVSASDRPKPGKGCLCCRNKGVLPPAELDGKPAGVPGLVDGQTALKCCDDCLYGLFLGGGPAAHPHEIDVQGIIASFMDRPTGGAVSTS